MKDCETDQAMLVLVNTAHSQALARAKANSFPVKDSTEMMKDAT